MQIVGYRSAVDGPATLLFAADGSVHRHPLEPGSDLRYALDERHCAGTIDTADGDNTHTACDEPTAPYCERHTDRWPCARCTGECSLPVAACREPHAVYLAAFAPATFKVGVTRSWRLETRLREQGADRAAHLRTVNNGRIARQIERDIAADIGDSVRVRAKIDGVHRAVDDEAWATLLAAFDPIATYAFEYDLSLSARPVRETLATGTVRGSQGRVLVLETGGSIYAVDMRALVGYDVEETAGSTDRQASLAAYD